MKRWFQFEKAKTHPYKTQKYFSSSQRIFLIAKKYPTLYSCVWMWDRVCLLDTNDAGPSYTYTNRIIPYAFWTCVCLSVWTDLLLRHSPCRRIFDGGLVCRFARANQHVVVTFRALLFLCCKYPNRYTIRIFLLYSFPRPIVSIRTIEEQKIRKKKYSCWPRWSIWQRFKFCLIRVNLRTRVSVSFVYYSRWTWTCEMDVVAR